MPKMILVHRYVIINCLVSPVSSSTQRDLTVPPVPMLE